MTENMERLNGLFDRLVPKTGAADIVAGEIVRAAVRICYRYYNDGDKAGMDYGNETVNSAVRYLENVLPREVSDKLPTIGIYYTDSRYEEVLDEMSEAILGYLGSHPELESQKNTDDMLGYMEPEDFDYLLEDEDDYYDEDDYDEDEFDEDEE